MQTNAPAPASRSVSSILPILVSAVLVFLILRQFSLKQLSEVAAQISTEKLLLACLPVVIMIALGALNRYLLLSALQPISALRVAGSYPVSLALALVAPLSIGELIGFHMLMRKADVSFEATLTVISYEKVVMLIVNWILCLVGMFIYFPAAPRVPLVLLAVATSGGLAMLFSLPSIATSIVSRWPRLSTTPVLSTVLRIFSRDFNALLRNTRMLLVTSCLTLGRGVCMASVTWIILVDLGALTSFKELVLLNFVSRMICYLPISLNGLGLLEVTASTVFQVVGVPKEITIVSFFSTQIVGLVVTLGVAGLVAGKWAIFRAVERQRL